MLGKWKKFFKIFVIFCSFGKLSQGRGGERLPGNLVEHKEIYWDLIL